MKTQTLVKLTVIAASGGFFTDLPSRADDAIVAAEPESVEHLLVCDAYGTSYFSIPGTETCLRVGGYVRFDVGFGFGDAYQNNTAEDWGARTRAKVWFDAKNETDYGTLSSKIVLESNYRPSDLVIGGAGGGASTDLGENLDGTFIEEAYIELGGFRVGKFLNWWDDDLSSETEAMKNATDFNAIRFQYENGDFYGGFSLEELGGTGTSFGGPFTTGADDYSNSPGYDASVGGKVGGYTWAVYGGYDSGNDEGAVTARVGTDIGQGKFDFAILWSSGLGRGANGGNAYYNLGEWGFIAQYAFAVNDKFSVTPAVQYNQNITTDADGSWDDGDFWRAGVTLDYRVVPELSAKATATYVSEDYGDHALKGKLDADWVEGFFRLERNF